ncbi:MAG: hypothetical protein QOH61_1877 [Chloroflexota bacterium]|nr:hypothetical protein [Chloroflexota bacterium]
MKARGDLRRSASAVLALLGAILILACSGSAAVPESRPGSDVTSGEKPAATAAPGPGTAGSDATTPNGPLIVRTGTLRLQVDDVDGALASARDRVAAAGGYVSASEESAAGQARKATITYRIPVDRWQEVITALRGMAGRVESEITQADEVTSQVVDVNARIENLRASETSLRAIMDRAGSIDDVLAVQSRLQAVQEDIERLVAQQQDLTGRAALGTLSVTWITPDVAAVDAAQSGWNLGREVDRALAQTVGAAQAFGTLLIWLVIVGIPVLGPILLVVFLAVWLLRRYQVRHPAPVHAGWVPAGGYVPQALPPAPMPAQAADRAEGRQDTEPPPET